jgi:2-polyprenyl-3-methyl-5-hydroxy-6-metoxy-1,4-benzoquinol methylase
MNVVPTPKPDAEPCDICGAHMRPYLEVSLSRVLPAWVHHCDVCDFRQVRPRLRREQLDLLYPSEYFDARSDIGFGDYAAQAQRNERAAYLLARDMRRLGVTGPVLEVGCALGFLIDALRRFGGVEVRGVDVSSFAAYFARERYGLDVVCGTLEEAAFPDGAFGAVIAKDLLEHVTAPRAFLTEAARVMQPGALLWLVTPNGEANLRPLEAISAEAARAGADALPVLTQGHLSFFSPAQLARLFDQTGFEVVRMRNIGIDRGLRALGYLPRKRRTLLSTPRHRAATATPVGSATRGTPEHFAELADELGDAVSAGRSPVKSSRWYYHVRSWQDRLKSLPARFPLGVDFEYVLRRR